MKDARFAEHLSVFVDVVRGGSFSSAARRRGATPSAVMRQIDSLEQSVGVALLVRSTRGLATTEAGQRLFERARLLLDDLADAHAEISAFDGSVSGVLRIACFPTFGKRYVIPTLDTLVRDYPDLRVELDLTERLADPVLERLDAVIRIGDLADSSLIATRIASQTRLLVAAPEYLRRHGTPGDRTSLYGHRLVDKLHGADLLGWTDVLGHPAGLRDERELIFRCDDFEAMRAAVLAGMGLGLLPDWVVGSDVRAGTLLRIDFAGQDWNARDTGIHLLRALPQPSTKVRAFTAALRAHIGSPPTWRA